MPGGARRKLRSVRKTGPGWVKVVRLTDMLLARWLPAAAITENYAVHEGALFRYSQRGMLGARWDEATSSWLYDVMRVRELFLHREAALPPAADSFGTLGEARLAGAGITRRPDARTSRQPLRVHEASALEHATASDRASSDPSSDVRARAGGSRAS